MSDLISRQAAIDALDERCESECEYSKKQRSVMCDACYLGSAKEVIEALPTIEPKRGKWITKKDACGIGYQICSNCETEIQWRDRRGVMLRVDMQNAPFCPNCGARMERSEDGET